MFDVQREFSAKVAKGRGGFLLKGSKRGGVKAVERSAELLFTSTFDVGRSMFDVQREFPAKALPLIPELPCCVTDASPRLTE
jgi:hypothetical protein